MESITELFSQDGALADAIPGFVPRSAQQEMAGAVSEALAERAHLMVEAGTGTGKTFAYLVPALLSGRRVIISTGTRTLQDQLFKRDLPMVANALGRPVDVSLLKGRSNYLCLHRLQLAQGGHNSQYLPGMGSKELNIIEDWSRYTETGDIAEVTTLEENSSLWPSVTSTVENCLGGECPQYKDCHVLAARRNALAADILIVNHHLLLADMALKEEGFGDLLGQADAVIIDEAHQLPDIAARFFGTSVGSRALTNLVADAIAECEEHGVTESAAALESIKVGRHISELRSCIGSKPGNYDLDPSDPVWMDALDRLIDTLIECSQVLEPLAGASNGLDACRARLALSIERLGLFAVSQADGVRWVDMRTRSFILNLTPFDVSSTLGSFIHAVDSAWIFTSATLAVGDDFSHFIKRTGLETDARSLRLGSPFDFEHRALLYLPPDMPLPGSETYTRSVVDRSLELIRCSEGRAFLLFTSHRALREAHELLSKIFPDGGDYPLLVQGSFPRDELLRQFRELGNAILLGTASFWEGVDVRGDALGVVVIDKLPFASPGDPLVKARITAIERDGGNAFMEHQLPQAVISLKQGVGRLIRDHSDSGVIMLCDPRIMTRQYGSLFLSSLPPMPLTDDFCAVREFLEHFSSEAADSSVVA